MKKNTRTITVTGIDGSGKSTLTKRVVDMFSGETGNDVIVMNCPGYHNTPNAPLSELSLQLDAFTKAADMLGSFELKAISLFFQISLFGNVESFLKETFQPAVLLNERHAVFDCLSYGNFYQKMLQKPLDRNALEAPLKEALEAHKPGTYNDILNWTSILSKRTGLPFTLWENIDKHVIETFQLSGKALVENLQKQFLTTLPDVILLLDVPGVMANSRVDDRGEETRELHEQAHMLEALRQEYFKAIELVNTEYPEIETHIIESGDETSIQNSLNSLLDHFKLTG